MINLFITGNEGLWDNSPAVFPADRCLTEYILPKFKNEFLSLSDESIKKLTEIPCIFAYEKGCGCDALIGRIQEIRVRSSDVLIRFILTGEKISADVFPSICHLLDVNCWELTRTHWTIKDIDLEDLQPYFVSKNCSPIVFVSYSWTPMRNQEVVFDLVSKLRSDGITVVYDKEDLHPGQNINFYMEKALKNNDIDNIIVICNKEYAKKADNRQGGVGYEAGIIISEIKSAPLQRRVIPVVIEFDESGKPYLPTGFRELCFIDITQENGYGQLVKAIKDYKKESVLF